MLYLQVQKNQRNPYLHKTEAKWKLFNLIFLAINLDFDKSKPPTPEVQNGTRSLGTNGRDALETVSPEILQQTGEGRHFGEGTSRKPARKRRDMMGDLSEQGLHRNEVLEIVLPQFILLTPEKDQVESSTTELERGNRIDSFSLSNANFGVSSNAFAQGDAGVYLTNNQTASTAIFRAKQGNLMHFAMVILTNEMITHGKLSSASMMGTSLL